jgi:hypothetical protein
MESLDFLNPAHSSVNSPNEVHVLANGPPLYQWLSQSQYLVLLAIFICYFSIFVFHVRFTAPVYTASHRHGLQKRLSTANFFVHICAGTSEVLRWHIRSALYSSPPIPDRLDICLCLLQVATSHKIAKYMRRGLPIMTRKSSPWIFPLRTIIFLANSNVVIGPSFQAGSILRLVLSTLAFWTANASLHKSSVAALNGFIYTRLFLHFMGPIIVTTFGEQPKKPHVYKSVTRLLFTVRREDRCGHEHQTFLTTCVL